MQVDYAEAARAAVSLEPDERARRAARPPPSRALPLAARVRRARRPTASAAASSPASLLAAAEAFVIAQRRASARDAQVLWYAPLAYAAVLGALVLAGGARARGASRWPRPRRAAGRPSLAWLATLVPSASRSRSSACAATCTTSRCRRCRCWRRCSALRLRRCSRCCSSSSARALLRGGLGRDRSRRARARAAGDRRGGRRGSAARWRPTPARAHPRRPPFRPRSRERPNIILVMVDTLRADHLSCYGGATRRDAEPVPPRGRRRHAASTASRTPPGPSPRPRTLLTSLLPTQPPGDGEDRGAAGRDRDCSPRRSRQRGYATGGVVSNINLTEAFGFDQGFDEYHYLGARLPARRARSRRRSWCSTRSLRSVYFKLRAGAALRRLLSGRRGRERPSRSSSSSGTRARASSCSCTTWIRTIRTSSIPTTGTASRASANQHPSPAWPSEMHALYNGEIAYLDGNFGAAAREARRARPLRRHA